MAYKCIRFLVLSLGLSFIYYNAYSLQKLSSELSLIIQESEADSAKSFSEEEYQMFMSGGDTIINKNLSRLKILNPIDTSYIEFLESYDKIITLKQNVLIVKIKKITPVEVEFLYPLNTKTYKLRRDKLSQIIFANGQRELFEPIDILEKHIDEDIIVRSQKDWEKVISTYNETDIPELNEKGDVKAIYEADMLKATNEFLEKNATIILKKKTANLKAHYVLITSKDIKRPYGEYPYIELTGIAYGFENIDEEE